MTTDVAAKAVRVSRRTVRRYIERGELKAKPHGEGVRREWLVSVNSLHVLRSSRTDTATRPRDDRDEDLADVLRELVTRLEERTAEAVEYRTRLELTELAHSTAEEERRRLLSDLDRERGRADRAEEARRLRGLLEASQEPRDGYETVMRRRAMGEER